MNTLPSLRAISSKSTNFAIECLLALPEVRKAATELKLEQGLKLGGLSSPGQEEVTLRLHRKNVTLREALNAIARAHGSAVWQYSEWHCDGEPRFAIEFLIE